MYNKNEEYAYYLAKVVNKFTDYFSDKYVNNNLSEDSWHYIPYSINSLMEDLEVLHWYFVKTQEPRILEVGCGIGVNAYFIGQYFSSENIKGIDIDSSLLEIGEMLFREVEFEYKDAMEEDYSQYDIIFFYMPFSDEKKQKEFEFKILDEIKSETAVMSGNFESKIKSTEKVKFLTSDIYIKK